MYKALIVDDEDLVRQGLCSIIDWESHDFTIVGDAANGNDAVEKIKNLQPDFVLLDITMPGMSGIDLLEAIKNTDLAKKPLFLILSGYAKFEYAQQAMDYGVIGYILKPVDEDELIQRLEEIKLRLVSLKNDKELQKLTSDLSFRNSFLNMLQTNSLQNIQQKNDSNTYQILLVSAPSCGFSNNILELENTAKNMFAYISCMIFVKDQILIIVFMNTPEQLVKRYALRFCQKFGDNNSGAISTLGHSATSLEGALDSYNVAKNLLPKLFFSTTKYFLMEKNENLHSTNTIQKFVKPNPFLPHINEVIFFIETYNIAKIDAFFDQYKTDLNSGKYSEHDIKKMCMNFMITCQHTLQNKYPEKKQFATNYMNQIDSIYEQNYFSDVYQTIITFTHSLTESFRESSENSTIMKVVQYVKANYKDDLKLDFLGNKFNCNSAYLGKKFKEYTEKSFNTFMDEIRINEAKKLLTTTSLKVYQIAELIGYTSSDYFYLKFKKITNLTPKQYRESYIK